MPDLNVDIEVDLECKGCGGTLDGDQKIQSGKLVVELCEDCILSSYEKGDDEGYKRGYKEGQKDAE